LLVSSGVRVTWAHHAIIEGLYYQFKLALRLTIFLGIYFTMLQGLEYYEARFTFADTGATRLLAVFLILLIILERAVGAQ
jgi:heme/copper-type cytochrome/quinol oxidase subunit 3